MGRKHRRILSLNRAVSIGAGVLFAIATLATGANAQTAEGELPRLSEALEPLSPGVTENQVFAELASHNDQRKTALHDHSVLRTYEVLDLKGKVPTRRKSDAWSFSSQTKRLSRLLPNLAQAWSEVWC
jgi:hypothetical protein